MNIYNVGLHTDNGVSLGFHVMAESIDAAQAKARAYMAGTPLQSGATLQRRDTNGGNEYFDRIFTPLIATLL